MKGYTQDMLIMVEAAVVEAQFIQVGDVVEVEEGKKVLVKTVTFVGQKIQITAFGHDSNTRWYFQWDALVAIEALTFTADEE